MHLFTPLLTMLSVLFVLPILHAQKEKAEHKVEVLLVGSSHWAFYQKPGLDVAQTNEVDILAPEYQKELAEIAAAIKAFGPDKIFVERTLSYQSKLDSLFQLYLSGKWGADKRNEIVQLGFRVAKLCGHERVYGIDYKDASFPFDSLMKAMKIAGQEDQIKKFEDEIASFEADYNKLVHEKKSLREIFAFLNNPEKRKVDLGWYITEVTQGGALDNTIGAFLGSEWLRRNIYSFGYIQKYVEEEDDKIMILMGASHIAVIANLLEFKPEWKSVELEDILGSK